MAQQHTRTPLMAGNWKMNLNHQEAVVLVQKLAWTLSDKKHDYKAAEVVVIPPFTDLRSVQTLIDGDSLALGYGAQDVSIHDNGAYTGEISAEMLAKLGCSYVVVGHSERREYHQENDALVNAKAHKALGAGIVPIVCVGEGLATRQAGEHVAYTIAQVDGSLSGFTAEQIADLLDGVVDGDPQVLVSDLAKIEEVSCMVMLPPLPCESCTAVRSRLPTWLPSWPRKTWMEPWSAVPVCRSTSSVASVASTRCPSCEALAGFVAA